ncbi:MAG TPA: hypothetical protein PLL88_04580 [Anaerolineaceae bacterium]|jgi:hypothetical protein|nr:hypothetical protein [Anaerolineaceae bacterium]
MACHPYWLVSLAHGEIPRIARDDVMDRIVGTLLFGWLEWDLDWIA